jgi:putative ABC transport system substrate-binding protein
MQFDQLGRRNFITLLAGAAAWPLAARTQQPSKIYRLGLLANGPTLGPLDARRTALLSGLAARGFVDGQSLVVVERSADARPERLDGLVGELKAANVHVIVTFGYPAALAAKKSTKDIPIVVTGAGDPVATGLVDGLARPGGNMTGVTELGTELSAKRLEILRDALPALSRVAMLWNAADLGMTLRYRSAEDAARVLGIKVQTVGVREPEDFDHAFAEMTRERPDAILMVSDALTMLNRRRVVEFARTNRLPTIFRGCRARARWRPDVVWPQAERNRGEGRLFRRPHLARRAAGGPAARTAHALRAAHQSQNRTGAPHHAAADAGRPRRRGDRMNRREFISVLGGTAAACTGRQSDQVISRSIGESCG